MIRSPWRTFLSRGTRSLSVTVRGASSGTRKWWRNKTPQLDQTDQASEKDDKGPSPIRGRYGHPLTWIVYAGAVWLGGHVFVNYFFSADACYGISMLPTIASYGEWIWISKYYRRGRGISIGDIVSFKSPIVDGDHVIKRVIGLPGDFVLMDTPGKSDTMAQVPAGHCWVAGDNLLHSRDSRTYGPLPMALIKGKVVLKCNFHHYYPSDVAWLDQGLQPAVEADEDID